MRTAIKERLARTAEIVGIDDIAGSRAVVLCTNDVDQVAGRIAVSAPSAVVAVAVADDAPACQALFEATLFPASRIVGCAPAGDSMADAACRVVEAALFGAEAEIEGTVMRDGRYEAHRVALGLRGVARVLA